MVKGFLNLQFCLLFVFNSINLFCDLFYHRRQFLANSLVHFYDLISLIAFGKVLILLDSALVLLGINQNLLQGHKVISYLIGACLWLMIFHHCLFELLVQLLSVLQSHSYRAQFHRIDFCNVHYAFQVRTLFHSYLWHYVLVFKVLCSSCKDKAHLVLLHIAASIILYFQSQLYFWSLDHLLSAPPVARISITVVPKDHLQ